MATAARGAVLPGVANRQEEAGRPSMGLPIPSCQRPPPSAPAMLPIAGRDTEPSRGAAPQEPDRGVGMVTTSAAAQHTPTHQATLKYVDEEPAKMGLAILTMLPAGRLTVVARILTDLSELACFQDRVEDVEDVLQMDAEALVHSWHGKLSNMYDVVNIVGEGRSGAVFIVQHKRTAKCYACKFLKKGDHEAKSLRTEIQTLRRLDHPNIVRLYETHEDGDTVFLLMELCNGGDLLDNISEEGSLSEPVARIFAHQMLSALAYCHANGVAHRDVKPENFLLDTEDSDCLTLKLADFGIATSIRPEHLSGGGPRGGGDRGFERQCIEEMACGSLPYMAPETFTSSWRRLDPNAQNSMVQLAAADLWSCGVTIYAMLGGRLPFGEAVDRICSGAPPDFTGPPWDKISDEAADLVRALLNPNAQERWTAQRALTHDWFRGSSPHGQATPDGLRSPEGLAENLRELALVVLRGMRRWRRMPKLQRIAIAAVAKRLQGQSDAQRVAESAYTLFSGTSETLRCEQLVQVLHGALCESMTPELARVLGGGLAALPASATPTPASLSTNGLVRGVPGRREAEGGSITGLHVRQRVRNALRRISSGSPQFGFGSNPAGTITTLEELRHLVAALDGMKNGMVDYTLFVASMLPPDMNYNEQQISEVFSLFDIKKRGFISPGDLQAAVRSGDADLRHYTAMISEFDHDGDGVLDKSEFRSMVQCVPSDFSAREASFTG
eukprot:CAMPEP_0179094570 /NCGR_PEP_ID=MMETSP0796-20121207/43379_1 /TAXON_ID=73915 /ORGANISM="Pyrodinium bahamense, Strain pbaha01" /LENGTH=726 /DNA_ID=CAMNT_0020792247 /DNA_START=61 /DNA_END=2242 /DNA_ORIENTATION=-